MSLRSRRAAEIYARALFDYAAERGREELYREGLERVDRLCDERPEFGDFLRDPRPSDAEKGELLIRMFSGQAEGLGFFLALLVERGRIDLLGAIRGTYGELLDAGERRKRVLVASAIPLRGDERRRLEKRLGQTLPGVGKVELEERVDPGLLGGLRVRVENRVIDLSLRGALEHLKRTLLGSFSVGQHGRGWKGRGDGSQTR